MLKNKADNYKEKSKKSFNQQAENYDAGYYGKHANALYNTVLQKLNQFSFNKLLDVGCGTGNLLSLISSKYEVQIVGIDLSPEMLNIARNKLDETADLRLCDSESLPFNDNSFDMVICTDSFHHYPNPANVLAEVKRVLKAGGNFIITDPWLATPFRQFANIFMPFNKDGDIKIYGESEIRKLLENAGFNTIEWEQLNKRAFIATAHTTN
ncbi:MULTISPECIES: class I SAM-dependent methyltransferase [Methanobacterium]|jgi:ubiquinone/menaquinone biosynthesis C-methylase UbiE|uniref:Methyltransferase domain-containing protein n=1 Tax=Methanobacterium veterum TaxID=408577 RepID=A0A9E5DL46_9EURY|nr:MULTISPECIES: class I SAM-dependent methyltransferase [Methanobacterium]MCZ3365230.1 methyltransferase domain-containing protein [Methanobacterium veterum]MCZ3372985.1 methyltransferase domain-containing protein [Methanobacterium veterum]